MQIVQRIVAVIVCCASLFTAICAHGDTLVPLDFNTGMACNVASNGKSTLVDESGAEFALRREWKRLAQKRARVAHRLERRPLSQKRFDRLSRRLRKLELRLEELETCRAGALSK